MPNFHDKSAVFRRNRHEPMAFAVRLNAFIPFKYLAVWNENYCIFVATQKALNKPLFVTPLIQTMRIDVEPIAFANQPGVANVEQNLIERCVDARHPRNSLYALKWSYLGNEAVSDLFVLSCQ